MKRLACSLAALACASCAGPLMKLPAGPGAPAADGADVIRQASSTCRNVSTLTAEVAASGSAAGHRVRTRLLLGVAAPSSARLEAAAPFGAPLFIFVARGSEATLVLPRDDRVLTGGRPDAVLEAVAGVPLDAATLRLVLTGCAEAPDAATARRFNDDWRVMSNAATDLYFHREPPEGRWRLVVMARRQSGASAWRADYSEFRGDLPQSIRLSSAGSDPFDLRLKLSQVDINPALGPEAFEVRVPRTASPITLDELRESGPFGRQPSERRTRDSNGR